MEAFEHFVKVALESEGLVVTSNLKFPVTRQTRRADKIENQKHGYEVDLVGARSDTLVLASVKSFFGSHGATRQGFKGIADESKPTHFKNYKLFNFPDIRNGVIKAAAKKFGYRHGLIELRLYVGNFSSDKERQVITKHLGKIKAGGCGIKVFGLKDILDSVLKVAESKTYINDPIVMTLKVLKHAKLLKDDEQNG